MKKSFKYEIQDRTANQYKNIKRKAPRPLSKALMFGCPFISALLCKATDDLLFTFIISVVILCVAFVLKLYAEYRNQGEEFPVYERRFTQERNNFVNVDKSDIEEMVVYLNDVENWAERNGYAKWMEK